METTHSQGPEVSSTYRERMDNYFAQLESMLANARKRKIWDDKKRAIVRELNSRSN